MAKKLYYTIEKELMTIDDVQETTGFKTINVYEIEHDTPGTLCVINDVDNDYNSRKAIQEWLDDNGFGDDEFVLIHL